MVTETGAIMVLIPATIPIPITSVTIIGVATTTTPIIAMAAVIREAILMVVRLLTAKAAPTEVADTLVAGIRAAGMADITKAEP